jgi:FtsH-binding integral membrane protein
MFRENELSVFSKVAISIIISLAACSAVVNIYRGVVPSPPYFVVTLAGMVLVFFAKFSVIYKCFIFSFGADRMSGGMANIYRVGYWLMVVGILCTFAG